MILDHTGHSELRPGHVATLPMKSLPRFTPQDLLHEVSKIIAGSGAECTFEQHLTSFDGGPATAGIWSRSTPPPTVGLNLNGIILAVTGYDRPAYSAEEIMNIDTAQWPSAQTQIARCRAHVEVAEVRAKISNDLDHNHDRALATAIVAIAVSRLVEVEGMVWHASLRCLPRARIAELATDLVNEVAPVELWIGVTRFGPKNGRPAGVSTRGLYQLLGAEIEVGQADFDHETAFNIALDLAERIITEGRMPEHGARMKFGAKREFILRHMPRGSGNEAPALALVPDSSGQVGGQVVGAA